MKLTEKQKNCPYCHDDKHDETKPIWVEDDWGEEKIYIESDGTISADYLDDCTPSSMWSDPHTINYCPMCGRPLSEEEEK